MTRTALHTRTLAVDTRPIRPDLLYVHAELRDVRHFDLPAYLGVEHPAGVVHHMALDLEVDGDLVIRQVAAHMATAPFSPSETTRGEGCRDILPGYGKLLGLKVDSAYAVEVAELVGGPRGCFHILSLAQSLPMAIRAAARRLCAAALRMPDGARPGVVDSCAQWRAGGPLWSRAAQVAGTGFREFRRSVRIDAWTDDGVHMGLGGILRDEPVGESPLEAELSVLLGFPALSIVASSARLAPPPFAGCTAALEGVADLRQLSIGRGFTGTALEKVGGAAGCAHVAALVIALTPVIPQAAGAFAGFLGFGPERKLRGARTNPQVDSCHMWRAGGPLSSL